MKNNKLIKKIKNLINESVEAGKFQDWVLQCEYLEKAFILYDQLSPESKKEFKNDIYFMYRELGRLYYLLNRYENTLNYLEKAKKFKEYKNEDLLLKCRIDNAIINSRIKLCFITNNKGYLKNVRDLNNFLLKKINNLPDNLQWEIQYNQSILQEIDKGKKVKTVICFEIPAPIFIENDIPINFRYQGLLHIIKFKLIKNPDPIVKTEGESFVEAAEDKYGILNRSKVKLTIYKYIDPEKHIHMKTFSDKKDISLVLFEALKALNYFIQHYKTITGNYWIGNVYYKNITNFTFENIVGNQKFRRQTASFDQLIRTKPNIPWLDDTEMKSLKIELNQKIPLWNILLLDAKDYLLRRNYREAIYSINGAFENYLMLKAKEILSEEWGEEEANRYLNGESVYERHKLKECIDEDKFNECVRKGLLRSEIPAPNQIWKRCYDERPLSISKTQVAEIVNKIRYKRNDVIHGTEMKEDLESIAFEAIKSFEKFISLFK